jgi:hypothetical protein
MLGVMIRTWKGLKGLWYTTPFVPLQRGKFLTVTRYDELELDFLK